MRTFIATVAVALLAAAPAAAACVPRASQASLETKLVCIQCHTTLDESSSVFAQEMKQEVARQIAACRTEDQIIASMVAEFGPSVLSTPQKHGFDLLAWILPLGGILLGAAGLAFGARQWTRSRAEPPAERALDAADEQRVDDALARFE